MFLFADDVWGSKNMTQFFVNCAQIEVVGPRGGTPGPLVKLPDAYKWDDPGILISPEMFARQKKDENFRVAEPPVWTG